MTTALETFQERPEAFECTNTRCFLFEAKYRRNSLSHIRDID